MRLIRYQCGCRTWEQPCYQRGKNHYIAVPEEENETGFTLEVSEIPQKGRKIWLGGKQANHLDFLAHVPQVEDHLAQHTFSESLYLKERYPNYQRRLDIERAENYGEWWAKQENSSVNAVVLAVSRGLEIMEDQGDGNHLWMEELQENFKRIHVPSAAWLQNNCPSCGTVEAQLNSIIRNRDSYPDEREWAQRALNELQDWAQAQEWRNTTLAKTYYCLNRHCPLQGDRADSGAYHQYRGLANNGLVKKPFEIIDGQHRVKGSQQGDSLFPTRTGQCLDCEGPIQDDCEDEGHDLEVYDILACEESITYSLVSQGGGFEGDFHGKLFTEITTEAKKLKAEHQLYMQWRFKINARTTADLFLDGLDYMPDSVSATQGIYNFRTLKPDMAYKLILMLNRFSITQGRLRPLGQISTGPAGPLKQYYSGSMKTYWAWVYHLVETYFTKILSDGGDNPYTEPRYSAAQQDIETMKEIIILYLNTALEYFGVAADWSADVNTGARISGPNLVSGDSETVANNAFPFQVISYLFPHVMKQAALEKYLEDTPDAEPQDLVDTARARNTNAQKLWTTINPSQITAAHIRAALSALNGNILGIHDNTGVHYLGDRRGYKLADILGQLVVKPLTYNQILNSVAKEVRDMEDYQ